MLVMLFCLNPYQLELAIKDVLLHFVDYPNLLKSNEKTFLNHIE